MLQLLWERFKQFARDTEAIGTERVRSVNAYADQLISNNHNDSAVIAEQKDGLNESWQDLLEMIDTRTQVRLIIFLFFICYKDPNMYVQSIRSWYR